MATNRAIGVQQHQIVQQGVKLFSLLPKQNPCLPIVNVGRTEVGPRQMTHRINHQKPLAALDALTTIKANLLSSGRGVFDTL